MKTKQSKPAKQSKPKRKPAPKKPSSTKTALQTENGVKVGDRVYCVYQGSSFPVLGTAAASFTCEGTKRIVVQHDEDVQESIGWGDSFTCDTTQFKVWGAQFVFPVRE